MNNKIILAVSTILVIHFQIACALTINNTPVLTLSNTAKQATGVIMSVTLTPVTAVANNGKIVITLAGAGLALANSGAAALTFTAPAAGTPSGTATLSGAGPYVLTIALGAVTANTYLANAAITFTIPGSGPFCRTARPG